MGTDRPASKTAARSAVGFRPSESPGLGRGFLLLLAAPTSPVSSAGKAAANLQGRRRGWLKRGRGLRAGA